MVEMIVLFHVSVVVVEFLMLTQHQLVIIPLAMYLIESLTPFENAQRWMGKNIYIPEYNRF